MTYPLGARIALVSANAPSLPVAVAPLTDLYSQSGNSHRIRKAGTATVSGAINNIAVVFTTAEPDATYLVVVTAIDEVGVPAVNSHFGYVTARAVGGFTINTLVAPGAGTGVVFSWVVLRPV